MRFESMNPYISYVRADAIRRVARCPADLAIPLGGRRSRLAFGKPPIGEGRIGPALGGEDACQMAHPRR